MPEDSKKNDNKKNAKEQRKPRQRHQQSKGDKKTEKPEETKSTSSKVTVPQKPPVYESPPPEFFKNLKRETDEILKITEAENTKYKKKEIESNWSKYEVPIESYDDIDEQENLGADYEKLIEAPLSVGGHFQFKHEKSWDLNTGPSLYDKYFEIKMEDLNTALCTIPFYERNNIEQVVFNESDILSMNNRSTRFKQKYFNDKSYSTPETEAQDKILNSLRDTTNSEENTSKNTVDNDIDIKTDNDVTVSAQSEEKYSVDKDFNLESKSDPVISIDSNKVFEEYILNAPNIAQVASEPILKSKETVLDEAVVEHDDFIFRNTEKDVKFEVKETKLEKVDVPIVSETKTLPHIITKATTAETKMAAPIETKIAQPTPAVAESPVDTKKNLVIESPEDLEKWLDDFLDG